MTHSLLTASYTRGQRKGVSVCLHFVLVCLCLCVCVCMKQREVKLQRLLINVVVPADSRLLPGYTNKIAGRIIIIINDLHIHWDSH